MREALRSERSHPRHSEVRQEAPGGLSRGTPRFVKRHQEVCHSEVRQEAPGGSSRGTQRFVRGSKREAFRFVSLRRHLHRLELLLRLLAPLLLIGELVVEARRGVVSMQMGRAISMHARAPGRRGARPIASSYAASLAARSAAPGHVQARTFGQHAIACQHAFTRQHAFTCQHAITWTRASSDVRRSASDLASATCGERRGRRGEHLHAAQ